MITTVNTKKMQISQSFTEYAQNRLTAKLDKFYNQMLYRAEQTAVDKNDALDACIDKIIRQIRRNKTRIEKKLKDSAFKQEFQDTVEEADISVLRTKKFRMRPMTAEEAILQMNMLGHSFFMFQNAATGQINVVYRREDEGYAVLEPDTE